MQSGSYFPGIFGLFWATVWVLNEFSLLILWVWNRNTLSVLFILSEERAWGRQVGEFIIPNLGAVNGRIVLLQSCGPFTFFPSLQPALSTLTFPLLPTPLTLSDLTISSKSPAPLLFCSPMPFAPGVLSGVLSGCAKPLSPCSAAAFAAALPSWVSFSSWTCRGGKPQKDALPPAQRLLTHCSLTGRSSDSSREVSGMLC